MEQTNNMLSEELEDVIAILTEQMIKDSFQNKITEQGKYIITKQDLYKFSIKLIKVIRGVYNDMV